MKVKKFQKLQKTRKMFDTANQTVETERYFNGKNEKFNSDGINGSSDR